MVNFIGSETNTKLVFVSLPLTMHLHDVWHLVEVGRRLGIFGNITLSCGAQHTCIGWAKKPDCLAHTMDVLNVASTGMHTILAIIVNFK